MPLGNTIPLALVLAVAMLTTGYFMGKSAERTNQLEAIAAAYEKRKEIDGNVQNLDAYGLCVELGGVPGECDELRGLDAAAKAK